MDPESHPTEKELKFSQVCDARNLKKVLTENPANPRDTISNIIYNIKSEKTIQENIIMLNIESQTIF